MKLIIETFIHNKLKSNTERLYLTSHVRIFLTWNSNCNYVHCSEQIPLILKMVEKQDQVKC